MWTGRYLSWPLAILAFYAVEAQMVFLFPLALDGCATPLRGSLALTRRAGGTLKVMGTVLPIAWHMLSGASLRSWCHGCLAIVLWYEAIR